MSWQEDEDLMVLEEVLMALGIAPEPTPTLAISEEGDGVRGLYLSGVSAAQLSSWLAPMIADTQLFCLGSTHVPDGVSPLPGDGWGVAMSASTTLWAPAEFAAVDVADVEGLITRLPTSVMAGPERALAEGVRFAIALQDDDHAVLYARDAAPLRAVLRGLVSDVAEDAFGEAPHVDDGALDDLLEPSPLGAWRRVQITQRRRYLQVDFPAFTEDGPDPSMDRSWVARAGGAWRSGWSW